MEELSHDDVSALTDTFRLLGEPNRLRLVLGCMEEPRTVGELTRSLAISQTLASQHLRLLRTARILRSERDGRNVRYVIDDLHIRSVLQNMVAHLTEPHEHHHLARKGDDHGR